MSSRAIATLLAGASLFLFASDARASFTVEPGFANAKVGVAPGGFVGGLDWLPNGHAAIFDGSAVVEVDVATGATVATLYTPPSFVFGSFVKVDPTGTFLLFGESSTQTIVKVPLAGGPAVPVTTLSFNYDCTFSPAGACFVSASPSGANDVYRVDVATGATDLIASIPGPSGPIAFDAAGDLYLGESTFTFPAPSGQRVFRFSAAQVASAIGPASLTIADAATFVASVRSPLDMVFDEEGDLLVADGGSGSLDEFDSSGAPKTSLGSEAQFAVVGPLAFRGNGPGGAAFEGFQRGDGGTLLAISTDFFSYNDLNVITPRRADISTSPASPIPAGPFTFTLAHAPAGGTTLLFLAGGMVAPEYKVFGAGVPLFFALDPLSFGPIVGPLPLDGIGELNLVASNPGIPATIAVQALLFDSNGAVVGTSGAHTIVTQ